MIKERLSARVETSRMDKLRKLADLRKKTITGVIEDWIDSFDVEQKS